MSSYICTYVCTTYLLENVARAAKFKINITSDFVPVPAHMYITRLTSKLVTRVKVSHIFHDATNFKKKKLMWDIQSVLIIFLAHPQYGQSHEPWSPNEGIN